MVPVDEDHPYNRLTEPPLRYVVIYQRTPIRLSDGRWTTDSFVVRDRASTPPSTVSKHQTREEATVAAAALNAR